jgi:hypothetical protein
MRACFLGQNVCALGYGVAIVQSPAAQSPDASDTARPQEQAPAPAVPNRMFEDLRRQLHS